MISKDALLFVRCRTYIYRFLSGSSVLALLRMVHVPLGSGPFQAIDRGPMPEMVFSATKVWIYFVCSLAFFEPCIIPRVI